jgi:hypothetical protein
MKLSIRFFDDREVRAAWDEFYAKWWFSVVDVVGILNEELAYTKAGNYWRWLKRKLLKADVQFVSGTHRLKFTAAEGEKYLIFINFLLQDLSKSRFLVSENRGRWTTYHLNSDYVEEPIPKVDTSKVKSKKLSTEELQGLIMKVCSEEFRTLEEVSLIIGKSVSYLKNKVFPNMIESGLLERLHPNINHPHQAYRAIPS